MGSDRRQLLTDQERHLYPFIGNVLVTYTLPL